MESNSFGITYEEALENIEHNIKNMRNKENNLDDITPDEGETIPNSTKLKNITTGLEARESIIQAWLLNRRKEIAVLQAECSMLTRESEYINELIEEINEGL